MHQQMIFIFDQISSKNSILDQLFAYFGGNYTKIAYFVGFQLKNRILFSAVRIKNTKFALYSTQNAFFYIFPEITQK